MYVYSQCRSVFEKDCYCIHLNSRKSIKVSRYAMAVFFKKASTARVALGVMPGVSFVLGAAKRALAPIGRSSAGLAFLRGDFA